MNTIIEFNSEKLREFKKAYEIANKENKEVFIFEEKAFYTNYAKYVIEYLNSKL